MFFPSEPVPDAVTHSLEDGLAVDLRAVMLRDAEGLVTLQAALAREGDGMVLGPEEVRDARETAAQIGAFRESGDVMLVATEAGRVVGTVDVRRLPVNSLRHNATLTMGVHPALQGRGLGRLLLAEGMRSAKMLGVRNLELNCRAANHRARTLYEDAGFRVLLVREGFIRWPDQTSEADVLMACDLTGHLAQVRPEGGADAPAIDAIHRSAFPTPAEAELVRALRRAGATVVSRVRTVGSEVIAHALFTAMTHEPTSGPSARLVGLAPVAVHPDHQRQGHGTALLQSSLRSLGRRGVHGVVLLGDPSYYGRLGFAPASNYGLTWTRQVPPGALQALALDASSVTAGMVRYHPLIEGLA